MQKDIEERKERNRKNPLSPLCWFLVVLGVSLIVSTIFCWELGAQSKSSFSSNLQSGNPSQRNPYKLKVIQLEHEGSKTWNSKIYYIILYILYKLYILHTILYYIYYIILYYIFSFSCQIDEMKTFWKKNKVVFSLLVF